MKRGGEEIYVGPLGHNSSALIEYFEVRRVLVNCYLLRVLHLLAAKSHWKEILLSGN